MSINEIHHREDHEVLIDSQVTEEHVVLRAETKTLPGLIQLPADGVAVDASLATRRRVHPCKKKYIILHSIEQNC